MRLRDPAPQALEESSSRLPEPAKATDFFFKNRGSASSDTLRQILGNMRLVQTAPILGKAASEVEFDPTAMRQLANSRGKSDGWALPLFPSRVLEKVQQLEKLFYSKVVRLNYIRAVHPSHGGVVRQHHRAQWASQATFVGTLRNQD